MISYSCVCTNAYILHSCLFPLPFFSHLFFVNHYILRITNHCNGSMGKLYVIHQKLDNLVFISPFNLFCLLSILFFCSCCGYHNFLVAHEALNKERKQCKYHFCLHTVNLIDQRPNEKMVKERCEMKMEIHPQYKRIISTFRIDDDYNIIHMLGKPCII